MWDNAFLHYRNLKGKKNVEVDKGRKHRQKQGVVVQKALILFTADFKVRSVHRHEELQNIRFKSDGLIVLNVNRWHCLIVK